MGTWNTTTMGTCCTDFYLSNQKIKNLKKEVGWECRHQGGAPTTSVCKRKSDWAKIDAAKAQRVKATKRR